MTFIPKKKLNVLQTFLDLTVSTVPYGREAVFAPLLMSYGCAQDRYGNWFLELHKSGGKPRSMFTCHLDTVSIGGKLHRITHRMDTQFVFTDGTSNLGADDKAGMCVLLSMIHQEIEGLYYFFVGEECGGIGSSNAARNFDQFLHIDRCISFDRRGYNSIITAQGWQNCCSDTFAGSLAYQFARNGLYLSPDDTGIFTDSANFTDIIPECTNISVGYFHEHTTRERQDMLFLERMCEVAPLVRWDDLPVARNPFEAGFNDYGFDYGFDHDGFDDERFNPSWDAVIDDEEAW